MKGNVAYYLCVQHWVVLLPYNRKLCKIEKFYAYYQLSNKQFGSTLRKTNIFEYHSHFVNSIVENCSIKMVQLRIRENITLIVGNSPYIPFKYVRRQIFYQKISIIHKEDETKVETRLKI